MGKRYQRGIFGIDDWIVGTVAAGVIGGLFSSKGQSSANETNVALAQDQMRFQERMSNTSYQRAIADMQAAGINPMLAASKGGASTPSGSQATVENSAAAGVNSAQQAMSSVAGAQQMVATQANIKQTEAATREIEGRTLDQNLTSARQAVELKKLGIDADIAEIERWIRDGVKAYSAKGMMAEADIKEREAQFKEKTFGADIRERKARARGVELETSKQEILKGLYEKAPNLGNSAMDWWRKFDRSVEDIYK